MKALVQRVTSAAVTIDGKTVGEIKQGLVAFIGVATSDTTADAHYLAQKVSQLRIFADESGKFNLSALDISGEILIVSQFTLLADTRKGRRPSFTHAAPPPLAAALCEEFTTAVRDTGLKVATGRFGEHMQVEIHNDGPVTIMLDSQDKAR